MSNFPTNFDNDITLPPVNDNITEIGGEAINALREAVLNIETNLGLSIAGSTDSLSSRLDVSIYPDGYIRPAAIAAMGLVTLPIFNSHISASAAISESKLNLTHSTQSLYNFISDLSVDINNALGWQTLTGSKLNPHLSGVKYQHLLRDILVSDNTDDLLKNKFDILRDNTDSYELIKSLNDELLDHHWSDSAATSGFITTKNGSMFPANYGHTATAIYLQPERFTVIPQTTTDVQMLAEYLDNSAIFLYGTRIQNLYSNGISRVSRSSSLLIDGYGDAVVPTTPVIAYLLNNDSLSNPTDRVDYGDDIVQFFPQNSQLINNLFDEQFALVKPGDLLRINYGSVQTSFIIKEKKYNQVGANKIFSVRIVGKNLMYSDSAVARIDRSLVNSNKFGVLAVSAVNNSFNGQPSLLVGDPRGAQTLGNGFNANQFDATHNKLYLALFKTGNPSDGYVFLPGIDVTGNAGATPGKYTLDSIVEATNNAFRMPGFNYRFSAFSYKGEFGIMLADSINNAGFSIVNSVIDEFGNPSEYQTSLDFPNNVISTFPGVSDIPLDPLGLGINGSGSASPPYLGVYASPQMAQSPTKLFLPLNKNNFYVNAAERDGTPLENGQAQDTYGDGYWAATASIDLSVSSRVKTIYTIAADLSNTGLAVGKTVVVKDLNNSLINSGRFIIEEVMFNCPPADYTQIVVYDAVHGLSYTPADTIIDGDAVSLYFDSDSASFNLQNASDHDNNSIANFKRFFEVYVDETGKTFTHERARFNNSNSDITINTSLVLRSDANIINFDFINVSSKLKGYIFDNYLKITLHIESYYAPTGEISGYLCSYDGSSYTKVGPTAYGKIGSNIKFYDFTNIDFIELVLGFNSVLASFTDSNLDIQLFKSLNDDQEVMMLATCQLNDSTKKVSKIIDRRQFGNISEKELSTSALDFISSSDSLLHFNGVIRGFDLEGGITNPDNNYVYLSGGSALVNGKIVQMNNELITIPYVYEYYSATNYPVQWALCISDTGEYKTIVLTDSSTGFVADSARTVQVLNPLGGLPYNVESSTFSSLINNRKDLTIIYIANTTISAGPSINVVLNDVRRFAKETDSQNILKYTNEISSNQGNYKTVSSIFKWLELNNRFNNIADISGASETLETPFTLSNVSIDGKKSSYLVLNDNLTISSNVHIQNVQMNFDDVALLNITSGSSNITFENVILNFNSISAFTFSNCTNISFKNCTMNVTAVPTNNSSFLFNFLSCNKVNLTDNIFNVYWDPTAANLFLFRACENINVLKNQIGNTYQIAICNYLSNNIKIEENIFNNSENITSGIANVTAGLTSYTYDVNNLVNSGRGYIYSNVSASTNNITINKNIFNNSTASASRTSFINFELSTGSSLLKNVLITDNEFNDTYTSGTNVRPAISIVNTIATDGISTTLAPRLVNTEIERNICNKDQMILITSKTISSEMKYPGLVAEQCSISKNTCGTIGYWVSRGAKTTTAGDNTVLRGHITGNLSILNNNCRFITCLDHTGVRFNIADATNYHSEYGSGYVLIDGNVANRIAVGVARDQDSSVKIVNNDLSSYSTAFFDDFGAEISILGSLLPAISVVGDPGDHPSQTDPNDLGYNNCIISNNTTSQGYVINATTLVTTVYKYDGILFVNTPAVISNNIFKGIDNNAANPIVLLKDSAVIFKDNFLYRESSTISSYVTIDFPAVTKACGIVKNNYFDFPTVNGTTETTIIKNSGAAHWIISENINQTEYYSMSMTNGNHFNGDTNGAFQFGGWDSTFYIKPAKNAGTTTAGCRNSNILRIHDYKPFVTKRFSWKGDLNAALPTNVKIIQIDMGIRLFNGSFTTLTNGGFESKFFVQIQRHNPTDYANSWNLDDFSTPDTNDPNLLPSEGGAAGVLNVNTSLVNAAVGSSTLNTTRVFTTPAPISECPMTISFDAVWLINSNSDFMISPIIIKYRW